MKNFKDFISEEKPNIKRKAKGEQDFVDAHEIEVTDPENSGTEGPAKVNTKAGSGKRKADKDNKQEFGEEVEELDETPKVDRGLSDDDKVTARTSRAKGYTTGRAVNMGNTSGGSFRGSGSSPYKNLNVAKSGERKGMVTKSAIQSTKERIKSRLNKEEVELDEEQLIEMDKSETPFTPDKPKKNPPAKAGKYGQGPSTAKHLAKLGLKKAQKETQKEEVEESIKPELEKHFPASGVRKHAPYKNPGLEKLAQQKKTLRTMKKSMQEADFTKQQTKMAHTIGKEFEKKGVGDEYKGGPYAVASAMVRDKPEAAKKAYKTIQSKMKEEADAELLFNLYNDLNEENQEMFMSQLEEDADSLLEFARMMEEE